LRFQKNLSRFPPWLILTYSQFKFGQNYPEDCYSPMVAQFSCFAFLIDLAQNLSVPPLAQVDFFQVNVTFQVSCLFSLASLLGTNPPVDGRRDPISRQRWFSWRRMVCLVLRLRMLFLLKRKAEIPSFPEGLNFRFSSAMKIDSFLPDRFPRTPLPQRALLITFSSPPQPLPSAGRRLLFPPSKTK